MYVQFFPSSLTPFLNRKKVLFMSIWGYGRERHGVLGNMLNTHPMALKHVMPAMMHFYIGEFDVLSCFLCGLEFLSSVAEVEQTGASSQFYDKFSMSLNDQVTI